MANVPTSEQVRHKSTASAPGSAFCYGAERERERLATSV